MLFRELDIDTRKFVTVRKSMVLYLYVNDVGTLRYSTKSVTNMFLIPHEIAKKNINSDILKFSKFSNSMCKIYRNYNASVCIAAPNNGYNTI